MIASSAFSTYAQFRGVANANIVFDGNSHNNIDSPSGAPERASRPERRLGPPIRA